MVITVSNAWLNATSNWFRLLYKDAAGANDFDTANAITVNDASGTPVAGDSLDARVSGNTINISYAYDTETAGGNVTASVDQIVVLQIGASDTSKSRSREFTITQSASIPVDATTDPETN